MSRGIFLKYLRPILSMCPEGSTFSADEIRNILKEYQGSIHNRYNYYCNNLGSMREITSVFSRRKEC